VKLEPALQISQDYESNPTHQSSECRGNCPGIQSDWITRFVPSLTLESEGEHGRANATVGFERSIYRDLTGLNATEPFARYKFTRDLSERLQLFGNGDYRKQESLNPLLADGTTLSGPGPPSDPIIAGGRPDLTRRTVKGGLRYLLDRRSSAIFSLQQTRWDYDITRESEFERDFVSNTGILSYTHLLSRKDVGSATIAYAETTFGDLQVNGCTLSFALGEGCVPDPRPFNPFNPSPREDEINEQTSFLLGWTRVWSPRLRSTLTGGFRKLRIRGGGFETIYEDNSTDSARLRLRDHESSTGAVGNASLSYQATKYSLFDLSFDKETRPGSGRAGTVDVEKLTASIALDLTSRLKLTVTGVLGNQESVKQNAKATIPLNVFPVPGLVANDCLRSRELGGLGGDLAYRLETNGSGQRAFRQMCVAEGDVTRVDTDWRRLTVGLEWRVRKRLFTFFSYDYADFESAGRIGQTFDDHRVRIGVRYDFEGITF
jgi:opacity protein-like surface antigen